MKKKMLWQGSFRIIPTSIKTALAQVNSDVVKVAATKKIPLQDVVNGQYAHLGITSDGSEVKRMLATWNDGVNHLRDSRMYALSPWKSSEDFEGIFDPPKLENPRTVVGRSELLAAPRRRKSK